MVYPALVANDIGVVLSLPFDHINNSTHDCQGAVIILELCTSALHSASSPGAPFGLHVAGMEEPGDRVSVPVRNPRREKRRMFEGSSQARLSLTQDIQIIVVLDQSSGCFKVRFRHLYAVIWRHCECLFVGRDA